MKKIISLLKNSTTKKIKMYKIKYDYETGDSFGTQILENVLELTWTDLKIAKENLKRIESHYKMYDNKNNKFSYGATKDPFAYFETYQKEDWFVDEKVWIAVEADKPNRYRVISEEHKNKYLAEGWVVKQAFDITMAENCLILYTDDNKPFQFWAPWCGYFEKLLSAEIIQENDDMKISF